MEALLNPVVQVGLLLVALVVGTFLGGILPLIGRWTRDSLSILLSFGAGLLLAVIFLQMIPTVIHLIGSWGGLAVLSGFIVTSLLESGLHAHRHTGGHAEGAEIKGASRGRGLGLAGSAVFIGLCLHSLMDGLALGTGMTLAGLAPSLFVAILLHKGPDAFALSTVLLTASMPVRRILWIQGLFSLATPVGAVAR